MSRYHADGFFKSFIFIMFSVLVNYNVWLTTENDIVSEAIQIVYRYATTMINEYTLYFIT